MDQAEGPLKLGINHAERKKPDFKFKKVPDQAPMNLSLRIKNNPFQIKERKEKSRKHSREAIPKPHGELSVYVKANELPHSRGSTDNGNVMSSRGSNRYWIKTLTL
jgi:hypothetical protein